MRTLSNLRNESRGFKRRKRVGRGPGSGMGKTSCRGQKGAGARSGYRRRLGYEGGQMRQFMKLPIRGFNQKRFQKRPHTINLDMLERYFAEGEVVNEQSLRQHGFICGKCWGVKVLAKGQLTKKLGGFEVTMMSAEARRQVEALGVPITICEPGKR